MQFQGERDLAVRRERASEVNGFHFNSLTSLAGPRTAAGSAANALSSYNPAVAAVRNCHAPIIATHCRRSGCRQDGDLRSSWSLLEKGGGTWRGGDRTPDLGSWTPWKPTSDIPRTWFIARRRSNEPARRQRRAATRLPGARARLPHVRPAGRPYGRARRSAALPDARGGQARVVPSLPLNSCSENKHRVKTAFVVPHRFNLLQVDNEGIHCTKGLYFATNLVYAADYPS